MPSIWGWSVAGRCWSVCSWGAWRHLLRGWLIAASVLLVFMELATPSFMAEYGLRPNRLFLEYLIYPEEVGMTLLRGHLLAVVIERSMLRHLYKLDHLYSLLLTFGVSPRTPRCGYAATSAWAWPGRSISGTTTMPRSVA